MLDTLNVGNDVRNQGLDKLPQLCNVSREVIFWNCVQAAVNFFLLDGFEPRLVMPALRLILRNLKESIPDDLAKYLRHAPEKLDSSINRWRTRISGRSLGSSGDATMIVMKERAELKRASVTTTCSESAAADSRRSSTQRARNWF